MSKLRKPLFSEAASGKLDEQTIFSTRLGKTYRKRYAKPKEPNTKAQMAMRKAFTGAMRLWQRALSEEDREVWRAFARKERKLDRVTLGVNCPPAHSVFMRYAVTATRAGFVPPKRPPTSPSPQMVQVSLERKGKGLSLTWNPQISLAAQKRLGLKASGSDPVLEVRLAVTPSWVRPWESLFRTIGFVPLSRGECSYTPAMPGKRYSFDLRVIAPDGQQSLSFRASFAT